MCLSNWIWKKKRCGRASVFFSITCYFQDGTIGRIQLEDGQRLVLGPFAETFSVHGQLDWTSLDDRLCGVVNPGYPKYGRTLSFFRFFAHILSIFPFFSMANHCDFPMMINNAIFAAGFFLLFSILILI